MSTPPAFDLNAYLAAAHRAPASAAARRRQAVLLATFPGSARAPRAARTDQGAPPAQSASVAATVAPLAPRPRPASQKSGPSPVVLALSAGSVICAIAAVVIALGVRDRQAEDPEAAGAIVAADPVATDSERQRADAPAGPGRPRPAVTPEADSIDASSVVRALRRASFEFRSDPRDAQSRFAQAVAVLGDSWTALDRSQRVAALELALEFLVRAYDSGDPASATSAAFAGADALATRESLDSSSLLRGVWSAGLATRVLREREIAPELLRAAEARAHSVGVSLGSPLDASFEIGALGALRLASEKLASPSVDASPASREAWKAWDAALHTAAETNPPAIASAALHAAESVLAGVSARPSDVQSRDRLTTLLAQCDWSSSGEARERLIGWIEDYRRFSTREVAVVTQWLANNADESGLGVNDTLSAGASTYQRSELRSRLQSRWGSGRGVVAASVLDRWLVAASLRGNEPWDSRAGADPIARLREAAHMARLNEAASLLWDGEPDGARRIIDDPAGALTSPPPGTPRLDALRPRQGDGAFSLRFLNARQNAQERIDILRGLLSTGTELGPIDAEVVFDAAMFGSPSEVRRIAARIVELRASDPTVINAAIEALPRAPRSRALADVFEAAAARALPPVDDPSWTGETRRTLVNRLLGILTGGASLDPADTYASAIKESYAVRAGSSVDPDSTPRQAAQAYVDALLAEISASGGLSAQESVELMRRRHAARRAIATGDMQRFAAEATNAAETFALLLVIERPILSDEVDGVLATLTERLGLAATVADQMEAAEFASLSLWRIRFGKGEPR